MDCSIIVIARGQVPGTTVAMASEDPKLQEAIAFLQKTNLNGESVYEQLAKVVGACPTTRVNYRPFLAP